MEQIRYDFLLIDILKERGFIKDEIIGFLLGLKTEENWKKMLDFLEEHVEYGNPKGRNKVYRKWYEIQNMPYPLENDKDDIWEEEEEEPAEPLSIQKNNKLH